MAEPTLDEQIEGITRCVVLAALVAPYGDRYSTQMRAVLATLQRHKRALAVVEAARNLVDIDEYITAAECKAAGLRPGPGNHLRDALDAFDAADTGEGK